MTAPCRSSLRYVVPVVVASWSVIPAAALHKGPTPDAFHGAPRSAASGTTLRLLGGRGRSRTREELPIAGTSLAGDSLPRSCLLVREADFRVPWQRCAAARGTG